MSLTHKIAQNTVVQLLGKVITTAASLGVVAMVTRSLGVSSYGEYTTINAYCQFFAVFADLGINLYLIKRLSTPEAAHERETSAMFGLRILSSVGVLLLAYLIVLFLPYPPVVRHGIAIVLWAIFAQTVNSLFVSILQARLEMQYAVVTDVAGRLVVLIFTAIALLLHGSLLWVVGAVTAGAIVNMLATYIYARRRLRFTFVWDIREWREIIREALPIGLTSILSFIYFKVDTVLLSTLPLHGRSNAVEVGIYGSAYKVLELLLIVPGIFLGNIFPVLSSFLSSKDERLKLLYQKALDVLALFGLPITMLVFTLARPIIQFIAGTPFLPAAVPLRILSFAILISYFSGLFTYTSLALGRQKQLAVLYAGAAVFNIVANTLFIPTYSYIAAAYTTLLTELIVLVGALVICHTEIRFPLSFRKPLRLLLIVLALGAAIVSLPSVNLFLTLLAVLPIYLFLVLAFRITTLEEVRRSLLRAS